MKLKPSLDVENIEDFKKYYEGAFLKGRDGTIWKVREVATRSKQVVMQIGYEGAFDELTIFDWDKVGRTLRFGRYFPGMFVSGNTLMYVVDSAERSVTRGLNFREVAINGLAHGVNSVPQQRDGSQSAWDALNQDYLIKPTDVWSKLRAGQCVVLNRFMGVAPHALPEAAIFVREQYVGSVNVDEHTLWMDYPHHWTTYGRILTKAFNGDLRYIAPGSREEQPPVPTIDYVTPTNTRADRDAETLRARRAIQEIEALRAAREEVPQTAGRVDWSFLRQVPPPTDLGQVEMRMVGTDEVLITPRVPDAGEIRWGADLDGAFLYTTTTTTGTTRGR